MVERFAEAVREDGVAGRRDPRADVHREGRGRAARARPRGASPSSARTSTRARSTRAWIGTIHGFCARVLRSQPLAAGLDPRFEVLDEARRRAARARRLRARAARPGRAARGAGGGRPRRRLRRRACATLVLGAHATLRAPRADARRGCRSRRRGAGARPAPSSAARAREARRAASPTAGERQAASSEALDALRELRARARRGRRRAVPGRARRRRAQGRARRRSTQRAVRGLPRGLERLPRRAAPTTTRGRARR